MQVSSRVRALAAVVGAFALSACGAGSDVSPAASTAVAAAADGVVTASGNGSWTPPADTSSTGTGTCTDECDGTGQGPGPGTGTGTGNGYGIGAGYRPGYGAGPGAGLCGAACAAPVGPDPVDIVAILGAAVQEEHKAEMLYRSVLATLGETTLPFSMIADAEASHVDAIEMLFARRSLTPPASSWSVSSFAPFASVALACAAGVVAETEDAAFYTPYLQREDIARDVRNVFTNLQRASLENHLPAFERCR